MESRKTVWLIAAIGTLVFIYVAVRAYILSFTWDESYTFLEFVRRDFYSPLHYGEMSANNHLLNTWCMKFMSAFFGNHEFSLRAPNVLAYILYAAFSAKISLRFSKPIFVITAFVLLNLDPFLLDFFSLARGYGLSMGFMMAGLFFLYRFVEEGGNTKHAVLALACTALGALANLPLVNFFIVLTVVIYLFLLFCLLKKKITLRKALVRGIIFLPVPLVLLCWAIPLSFTLRKANALYYGGTEGFWSDTVRSTIKAFLYEPENNYLAPVLGISVVVVTVFSFAWLFYDLFYRRKIHFFSGAVLFLLLACALLSQLQHFFLGTFFLTERTALFFIPLVILLLLFLLQRITQLHYRFFWFAPIFFFLFAVHFFMNINFYFVQQWRENADVKSVIGFLEKKKREIPFERKNIYMGIEFIYEPCLNYYRAANHLEWLNIVTPEGLLPTQDYFLVSKNRRDPLLNNADEVARFPSGAVLYKNHLPSMIQKVFNKKIDFEPSSSTERKQANITDAAGYKSSHSTRTDTATIFSDGFSYICNDSLSDSRVLVVFSAMVYVPDTHFEAMMVLQMDSAGQAVYWSGMNIKDYCNRPGQWVPVCITSQMPHAVKGGQEIKAYLWNTGKGEVFADDMELKILKYKF